MREILHELCTTDPTALDVTDPDEHHTAVARTIIAAGPPALWRHATSRSRKMGQADLVYTCRRQHAGHGLDPADRSSRPQPADARVRAWGEARPRLGVHPEPRHLWILRISVSPAVVCSPHVDRGCIYTASQGSSTGQRGVHEQRDAQDQQEQQHNPECPFCEHACQECESQLARLCPMGRQGPRSVVRPGHKAPRYCLGLSGVLEGGPFRPGGAGKPGPSSTRSCTLLTHRSPRGGGGLLSGLPDGRPGRSGEARASSSRPDGPAAG